jgi:hypothetical protein
MPTDKPPSPRSLILTPEANAIERRRLGAEQTERIDRTMKAVYGESPEGLRQYDPFTPVGKARLLAAELEYLARAVEREDNPRGRQLAAANIETIWRLLHVRSNSDRYVNFADAVLDVAELVEGESDLSEAATLAMGSYAIHFRREAMALDLEQVKVAVAAALGRPEAEGLSKWRAIAAALATAGVHVSAEAIERERRKSRAARKPAKGKGKR